MKKKGILNSHLSKMIASMGHTDQMVIGDAGLPLPRNAEIVDLALVTNIPRMIDVLSAVLDELVVEKAILAVEIEKINHGVLDEIKRLLKGVEIEFVSHEDFKRTYRESDNTVFVRTGESTPYANIILVSGVDFS
ncbi:TPA: D-ribose pyranase [Candidatus Marinimicrobia bacterium]|nr:MAG: high affinity ribose transporter RbsD [Marinimicrobia bacterium 46_47]HAE87815.1 D-ribose pyranase [Candidatus Neomarinimicrobiota bacterium]HBY18835.1 D-ribose pyranase [Candidatus Neomarinimicrobiota bacterium]